MTRLSLDRSIHIHALRDALVYQYDRMTPGQVMQLLRNIANSFPATSVSRSLAEQFRSRIRRKWESGTLTRAELILFAFPMLYESAVNLVEIRRRLSVILSYASVEFVFNRPNNALPNL